ncbi:FtsW/RodA/SpoVE family cell cycle protein [Dactylosporangium sp. NPDC000521]|uniref:FtsW/RodA/SpoVE family cell cycle protein n=1 Tax=Dactylosporangium sp. NPDC000521 TaxID=3363975 RepID=UPI00368A716A
MIDRLPEVASTLLVMAGLGWAVLITTALSFGFRGGRWPMPGPAATFGVPIGLLATGFWIADTRYGWWVLAATAAVLGLGMAARSRFAGPARAGRLTGQDRAVVAAVLATVTAAAVLTELGALMAIRLVVKPDPADSFTAALRAGPLLNGLRALGLPLFGVAVVAALAFVVRRAAGSRLRGAGRAAWSIAIRDGIRSDGPDPGHLRRAQIVLLVAVVVLFGAPLLPFAGGGTGGAALTFGWVATPEFGKLVFLALVALLVAPAGHWFDINRGRFGRPLKSRRYALYPLGAFCLVAILSGLRHDFGTVVSVLAATVGVTWAATRFTMLGKPNAGVGGLFGRTLRRLRKSLRAYRPFLGFGAILLIVTLLVAVFFTNYAGERTTIWADPWQYRWDSGCVRVDAAPAVPDGWQGCQRAAAADAESGRSQVARALSAVADGGLLGRGLADTTSSFVPAASTDFVLVVIWHKLGAVSVLLAAALTMLLGLGLTRAARRPVIPLGAGPTPVELFAAGLGAMIAGQFLFVFAAGVNVLPHSGVPAPLLSRGGQANLAILIGLLAVLAAGRALPGTSGGTWTPEPVRSPSAGRLGLLVPSAMCLAVVCVVTTVPYAAPLGGGWHPAVYATGRPLCPARQPQPESMLSPRPEPRDCSTDRLAHQRTQIEIRFGDRPGLLQQRPAGTWSVLDDPGLGGLVLADLAGLLRLGSGAGVLELTGDPFGAVLDGTAGTGLAGRLVPPGARNSADGWLSLNLDPRLQHATAVAMRSGGPGGEPPLVGGAVVIDAQDGRVLAAVTTPAEPARPVVIRDPVAERAAVVDYEQAHRGCVPGPPAAPPGSCWTWSIQRPAPGLDHTGEAELRRYVGGDPNVTLPDPQVNRALGGRHNLGEITMVLVAAAYLGQPGKTAGDEVPAAGCPGAVDGRLSLAHALATACAAALGAVAQDVGWSRIAAQAQRFGIALGDCSATPAWLVHPLTGGAGTCVPPDAPYSAAPGLTVGSTGVVGTPLGVATMMASIANGGVTVQPSLVGALARPASGLAETVPAGRPDRALPAGAATDLAAALHGVMRADDGEREVWLATGTYEVPAGSGPQPRPFADRYTWLAGFLRTAQGRPVAFATVVECRDDGGARRAQLVLDAISRTIGR